ncbi:polysaccharide biosynthesis/export family protein [Komagataeibacter xylinus]|uniref:polysaccharide biosynthesis/export family protein n=1 Tax=Komagataeibacter xylinus TaxID=28448 RepID=UPI00280B790D|nr:polysaccharide biosynthesis/export family protein [Komagataeibacter xylinus]
MFAMIRKTCRPGILHAIGATALLALGSCASGREQSFAPVDGRAYHLGPGDQVRVITYNDPQLSNTFTVSDNGNIDFPLLGVVPAAGSAPGALAQRIAADLEKKGILYQPSVSVEIAQYRPIYILGEVNHPGQYPYQPGMTMLTAVALAGGFTYRAVTGHATDVRHEDLDTPAHEGRISRETVLLPGDVVTVEERFF